MKQFKASAAIVIITILALVIVGGGVWYFVDKSDETADWKTYTNTKYGYELKYPSDWYVDTTFSNSDLEVKSPVNNIPYGGETYFSNYSQASNYSPYSGPGVPAPKGSLVVSLNVSRVDQNIDYDEFIPGYDNMTKEDININGIGAVKILVKNFSVEDSKFEFKNVYIKIDDKMFNLEYHGYPISEQMENIASKIINSFKAKLIDDETADWKTYTNEEYGFEIKFPDTWKGYTVKERILNWGSAGTSPSYDFGFSIQESLFNISMHTKDQWVKISSEEGPIPEILGQNDEYVFAQAMGQYTANDQMIERRNEISQILSTFKFIENDETNLKITFPNGGESLVAGKAYNITWESQKTDKVFIYLSKKGESDVTELIAENIQASLDKYYWKIPTDNNDINLGGQFKIKISAKSNNNLEDESDDYFEITK